MIQYDKPDNDNTDHADCRYVLKCIREKVVSKGGEYYHDAVANSV